MAARWLRSLALLACAALLLAGCGDAGDDGPVHQRDGLTSVDSSTTGPHGQSAAPPSRQEDAAVLVERALAARAANGPAEFAALVSAASQACPDPGAARRLGEVAGIAARWASALLEGRPKAQAVTEAQLAEVDWDALAAACVAARS